MKTERLISPSDLRKEAQRLIESDAMPPLEKLLRAVADAREKYGDELRALRAGAMAARKFEEEQNGK